MLYAECSRKSSSIFISVSTIYSDAITLRKTDVFGMALLYANQSYVVVSEFFKNVLLDFCLLRSKLIFRYLRFGALLVFSIKRITLTYDTKKRVESHLSWVPFQNEEGLKRGFLPPKRRLSATSFCTVKRGTFQVMWFFLAKGNSQAKI